MSGVCAILLAAGESRRMGDRNKLTLPLDGVPLLRRTALTLCASGLGEIVAVLGHEASVARPLLADLPMALVINDSYREGQMSSVHRGLEALSGGYDGVMICLSDQPLLTTADIDLLIEAFAQARGAAILVPTWQGLRGNPIVLDHAHRDAILAGDRNLGCRRLIERNPQLVSSFAMPNDHVVFDLDTPRDYVRAQGRLAGAGAAIRDGSAAAG